MPRPWAGGARGPGGRGAHLGLDAVEDDPQGHPGRRRRPGAGGGAPAPGRGARGLRLALLLGPR